MIPQRSHSSPFKGLVPYNEGDAQFFFGREAIGETIIDSLRTWRLTLLYGASGVGKSSVLHAGVLPRLRNMARESKTQNQRSTPEFAVVPFSSWRDDPVTALARAIQQELAEMLPTADRPASVEITLTEAIDQWLQATDAELYIILDQFEEYFQYHGRAEGPRSLPVQLAQAVSRSRQRIKVLLSIRDDAVAKLDQFKVRIPNLFDHILRVRPLSEDEARKAIEGPIAQYNAPGINRRVSIESRLLDEVLKSVKRADISAGGQQGATYVDAAILQQVMTRLWEEDIERSRSSALTLTYETFRRLGGAQKIVSTHFSSAMEKLSPSEQETAAAIFRYLVTPSGTKIAQTASDLVAYSDLSDASVTSVLKKLSSSDIRILRTISPPPNQQGEERYEIFHDVLSNPINDWWRGYEADAKAKQATVREQEIAHTKYTRRVAVGLMAMLIIVSAAALYAFGQRTLANASAEREKNARLGEETAKNEALEWARRAEDEKQKALKQAAIANEAKADAQKAAKDAVAARDLADQRTRAMEEARKTDSLYREAFRQSRREDEREDAIKKFNEALDVYLKRPNDPLNYQAATDTYVNIGEVNLDLGNEATASKFFQDALKRCKKDKDRAAVLTSIGDAYKKFDAWSFGADVDPTKIAWDKYKEALWYYENTGETERQADALIRLALLRYDSARYPSGDKVPEHEDAFALIELAGELFKEGNNYIGRGNALFTLADLKARPNYRSPQSSNIDNTVIDKMEEALTEYNHAGDVQRQIRVRKRLVRLLESANQNQRALDHLFAIATIYKNSSDWTAYAATLVDTALFNIRHADPRSPEYVNFILKYEEAARRYETADRPDKAAFAWKNISYYYRTINDTSSVARVLGEAVRLFHRADNHRNEVIVLYDLVTLFSETDKTRAADYLDQLMTVVYLLEKRERASSLLYLGRGFLVLKDPANAKKYFEEGLTSYQDYKDVAGERVALGEISDAYLTQSMFDESIKYLNRALLLHQNNPIGEARTQMSLGVVHVRGGKPEDAIANYQRAATLYKEQKYFSEQVRALVEVGQIYQSISRFDKAIETFDEARKLYGLDSINQPVEGRVIMLLAQSYQSLKENQKAIGLYEEAATFYSGRNLGEDESKALLAISSIYKSKGDEKNAQIYKDRAEKAKSTGIAPPPGP